MATLKQRVERLTERRQGVPIERGEPPHSWLELYTRLAGHVPRKRPPAPAVPMSPEEAYQAMTRRRNDPDEPKTPEAWWWRYLTVCA